MLVKQVPRFEDMALGPDGRLQRQGVEQEMNPYCRRAVTQGIELARQTGGTCTVFTLGPLDAADCLREAIACGADGGVLITDPAFAGSDTLATAGALAAALRLLGPFAVVLLGRNSVDADTGQVAPELAELMGLPFLGGVRRLDVDWRPPIGRVSARLEHDDGWAEVEVELPAVLSCAERLCSPAKASPESRAGVDPSLIRIVSAAELGPGPWGVAASRTSVGPVELLEVERKRLILDGTVTSQIAEAVAVLEDGGALTDTSVGEALEGEVPPRRAEGEGRIVAVVVEQGRKRVARELLGAGARVAAEINGTVVAVTFDADAQPALLSSWGADSIMHAAPIGGRTVIEDDAADVLGRWCETSDPWAVVLPGTMWGREVASRVAARLGAGLTGDAVDLAVDGGRLIAWKPAFGGRLVAAITASSPAQMVTLRPGVMNLLRPRAIHQGIPQTTLPTGRRGRILVLDSGRDDQLDALASSSRVVAVGAGVDPAEYPLLEPLLRVLGAELAATRKVTDKGWLPRSRQVGITGRSIAPVLYVAIGVHGKFNHIIGVRGAGQVVAINTDRDAPIFDMADVGIVGDWHEVIPVLATALGRHVP